MSADTLRIPSRGIIAEGVHHVGSTAGILSGGRFRHAPMFFQPVPEPGNEGWFGFLDLLHHPTAANSNPHQEVAVSFGAVKLVVITLSAIRYWTAAGAQMLEECPIRRQIKVGQWRAPALQKVT